MSAKINLYGAVVPAGGGTAVEPKEGYVYVVTKVTFRNEGDLVGKVAAGVPGRNKLVDSNIAAHGERGWELTEIVNYGESFVVSASPAGAIRCSVEGYFLIDVAHFAREGAGAMDADYAASGAIEVKDSPLAKMTYLALVELKRIRTILEGQSGLGSDRGRCAEEIDRELES